MRAKDVTGDRSPLKSRNQPIESVAVLIPSSSDEIGVCPSAGQAGHGPPRKKKRAHAGGQSIEILSTDRSQSLAKRVRTSQRPPTKSPPTQPATTNLSNNAHEQLTQACPAPKSKVHPAPRTKSEALQQITLVVDDRAMLAYEKPFAVVQETLPISSIRLDLENLVVWRRSRSTSEMGKTQGASGREPLPALERFALLLFEAEKVYSELQNGGKEGIREFLSRWRQPVAHLCEVHFLIIGSKHLVTKLSSTLNKKFQECLLAGERLRLTPTKHLPPWGELEQSVWLAGLEMNIHVQFLEKVDQLPAHVQEMTRCVAWEPYAHAHDDANFCVSSVRRSGSSLSDTWRKMLEEIGRVTPAISEAITGSYPTMNLLLAQYNALLPEEGERLLAKVPLGKRAIGPALSKRIYRVLTSTDGEQLANL